jgi:hypothetical protein
MGPVPPPAAPVARRLHGMTFAGSARREGRRTRRETPIGGRWWATFSIVGSMLARCWPPFAFTLIGLVPVPCGRGRIGLASGHGAGAERGCPSRPTNRGSQSDRLAWPAARPAERRSWVRMRRVGRLEPILVPEVSGFRTPLSFYQLTLAESWRQANWRCASGPSKQVRGPKTRGAAGRKTTIERNGRLADADAGGWGRAVPGKRASGDRGEIALSRRARGLIG